ncbi:EcsC family protein [Roseomonas sp. OT10]|uniref:EcsC family protein n=1 Tax=Roseomonas cutis TaxID=2897332 RepID=UPI001E4246D7|nr:EcsC family protein [Roseomonas sp. OT10]UFN48679.1 EcsC family protein [Roseomonas sp. OT10]
MSQTLPTPLPLTAEARAELAEAVRVLENPSLAARLAALAGTPVEALKSRLPDFLQRGVEGAVQRAVEAAWSAAVRSHPGRAPHGLTPDWLHRGLAAAAGAAGGAFGLPGTLTELPISTTILLRQIASEAADQGEDPSTPAVRAECLKVFALGGESSADDMAKVGYFASRLALAQLLPNAAANLTATVLPGFLASIAGRFMGAVGLKLSAQSVPVIGAAAGAAINLAFLEHFRSIARAHFTVRRLEATYGSDTIRAAYDSLQDARMAA